MDQLDLNFSSDVGFSSDGMSAWRKEYQERLRELAKSVGLPIGRRVRLYLVSGLEISGSLQLFEDALLVENLRANDLHLRIGNVDFRFAEIESCVVEDD